MHKFRAMGAALVAVLVLAALASATTPQRVNYQGILTDASGNPITVSVTARFRIYDQSSGGTVLYDESQTVSPDASGRINVELGGASITPISNAFNGSDRWLGITVGGDPEMTPRVHFTSVPYAFRVETVDGAKGGAIKGDVSVEGSVNINGTPGVDGVQFADNTIQTTAAVAGGVTYTPANTWRYTASSMTSQVIADLVPAVSGPYEARYITGIWLNDAFSASFTAEFTIGGATILRLDDQQQFNGSQQFWMSGGGAPIVLTSGETLSADVDVYPGSGPTYPWVIIVTGYDQ